MAVDPSVRRRPARSALGRVPILVAAGLTLSLVACGSGDAGGGGATSPPTVTVSPGTPTPNQTLCADAAALRASVDKLLSVEVEPGLADELAADLRNVRAKLATLWADTRREVQDEVAALESALSTLRAAIEELAANPGATTVVGVTSALEQLGKATGDLWAAIGSRCPSASPSPTR